MKKTPTVLKWLAEKRARIAGELESCTQVLEILSGETEGIRLQLAEAETLEVPTREKLERIKRDLAAIDRAVLLYDSSIRPDLIEPVNAWQGNYGKRGALPNFLMETLKSRPSEVIDTQTLAVLTIAEFSLVFENSVVRVHWFKGSFKNTGYVHSEVGA